jgi:hypothetical protein
MERNSACTATCIWFHLALCTVLSSADTISSFLQELLSIKNAIAVKKKIFFMILVFSD